MTAVEPLDSESAEWVRSLATSEGAAREVASARLHAVLLPFARSAARRKGAALALDGPELDDLAHQATADALLAIVANLPRFRGESRFTTWAYTFVLFEVSAKLGRHFWQRPSVALDAEDWDRLPDRFGLDPERESQWRELVLALRAAVDEVLTARQRRVFVALVLNGVPLDALAVELDSNRNALYKSLFDARRKLRARLVETGYLEP